MTSDYLPEPEREDEEWLDANVRHVLGLILFANLLRVRSTRRLDITETAIRVAIANRFSSVAGYESPADIERVRRLIARLAILRGAAWTDVSDMIRGDIERVARAEPRTFASILRAFLPGESLRVATVEEMRRLSAGLLVQGRALSEWISAARDADTTRIATALRFAAQQKETTANALRRILGSRSLAGRDGVLATTRRQLDSLIRTSVLTAGNTARAYFFGQNARHFRDELYVAVLDNRTTILCASLSGNVYPIGEGPHPPLHHNCRSHRVPRIAGGPVPSDYSYRAFLRRQSNEFQNQVLGSSRAQLFRSGELDISDFVNNAGQTITLDDLARIHADAFRRSGLAPSDFTR